MMTSIINSNPGNTQSLQNNNKQKSQQDHSAKNRSGSHSTSSKQSTSFQELLAKNDNSTQTSTQHNKQTESRKEKSQALLESTLKSDNHRSQRNPDQPLHPALPRINGTENNDFLFGSSASEVIDGKAGNDIVLAGRGRDVVIGGEGNDFLFAGKGNDSLHGGNGKDWLFGGHGHDKLDGGRGNDRLYGGAGNDSFTDSSGNNDINGGRGTDQLNLANGIDGYSISVNKQGEFTLSELTRRLDSPTYTVKNVEVFQFADVTLSASELIDQVNNPQQTLALNKAQQAAVESVFNINEATVMDKDGDGNISAGDSVQGTLFRETGTVTVSYQISQDNADHINGTLGAELKLPASQLQQVNEQVNAETSNLMATGVLDTDHNGQLSVGDVVISRSNLLTTGGDPIGGSPIYHRLTAENIKQINADPSVPLSTTQREALNNVLSIPTAFGADVLDNDGNGQLSAGDTVVVSGGITGGEILRLDLTADQVSHINGEFGPRINLNLEQITSLLGAPIPSDFGYYALDSDHSGTLSAGDKLVTFGTFTLAGVVNPNYRTISAADIQGITDPSAGLITEISNQGIDLNAGKELEFEQLGNIHVAKQQLPAYLDKPFEQHIISTQAQLNQLRTDLGLPPAGFGGGLPGTELPNVDFNKQVLVYTLGDAANPNLQKHNFTLTDDGTLSSLVVSTKIGFEASDIAQLEFFAIARDGIEQFATNDPLTDTLTGPEIEPPVVDPAIRSELETNQQKWNAAGLNNYSYTLQRSCFCTEEARRPVENSFENGLLSSRFTDGSNGQVPDSNQLNVKDLFKIIDDAINRDAAEIRVEYDSKLGHPKSIYIDYDQRMADEELSLTINHLKSGAISTPDLADTPKIDAIGTPFTSIAVGSQFNLDAPFGSDYVPQQGFDSFVGLIKAPNYELSFDKGLYSSALRDNGQLSHFKSEDVIIDGKHARIVTAFNATPGAERPYFAGVHFPDETLGFNSQKFTMTTNLTSADLYAEIQKIFRSLRF